MLSERVNKQVKLLKWEFGGNVWDLDLLSAAVLVVQEVVLQPETRFDQQEEEEEVHCLSSERLAG